MFCCLKIQKEKGNKLIKLIKEMKTNKDFIILTLKIDFLKILKSFVTKDEDNLFIKKNLELIIIGINNTNKLMKKNPMKE